MTDLSVGDVAEFLEKYQLDVLFVGREVLDELREEEK